MTKITWIRFQSSGNIDRDSALEFGGCSRHFHRGGPTIPGIFHLRRILFLLGALLLAWPALADYYDGLREWDAGRYQEAWVKWQEAAGEGDARSMMAIGRLYEKRLGGAAGLHRSAQVVQPCRKPWHGRSPCRT